MCGLHIKVRPDTLRQNVVGNLRVEYQFEGRVLSLVTAGRVRVEFDCPPVLEEVVVFARVLKVIGSVTSIATLVMALLELLLL